MLKAHNSFLPCMPCLRSFYGGESAAHINELAERLLAIYGMPVATMKEVLEIASIYAPCYSSKLRKACMDADCLPGEIILKSNTSR